MSKWNTQQWVVTRNGEHVAWLPTEADAKAQLLVEKAQDMNGWSPEPADFAVKSYWTDEPIRIHFRDANMRLHRRM